MIVRMGSGITIKILLSHLHGYHSEGRNIHLSSVKQGLFLGEGSLVLTFPTEPVMALAFAELQNFARELTNQPIPLSSSESDD